MKISFIMMGLKDFKTGGYYANFKVLSALEKAGHEIDIIHHNYIPENIRGKRFKVSLEIFNRIKKNKPDLIIINKSYTFLFFLSLYLIFTKIPVLYIIHHLEWHDIDSRFNSVRKILARKFLKLADSIWVVSKSTCNDIIKLGIKRERINVIPPGFERFEVDLKKKEKNSLLKIISVGTLTPRKDQLTLLKACSLLKNKNFQVIIAGDDKSYPEYAEKLIELAGSEALKGKVLFTGYMTDEELHKELESSNVLVNPALWEGYGIALVEGLWSGLPVIAAEAGAVPELIKHGDNGFLIKPGDYKSLAEYIELLFDNKTRETMSKNARLFAEKIYTWEDTERDFVKLAEKTAEL